MSNIQGVTEETFIQTGRRDGDGQLGGQDSQQGGSWWSERSHICVQINWEEHLGNKTDCYNPGK